MPDARDDLIRKIEAAERLGMEFGRGMAWAYREVLELIQPAATEPAPITLGITMEGEHDGQRWIGTVVGMARGGLRQAPIEEALVEWLSGGTSWKRFDDLTPVPADRRD